MKLSFENRVNIVEQYVRNEIGISRAAQNTGVSQETIRSWIRLYENGGPSALLPVKKNCHYSKELKLAAVTDYLNGLGSMIEIGKKYSLRSKTQLQNWLKDYNTHKDFKSTSGGSTMSKGRMTTIKKVYLSAILDLYDRRIVAYIISDQNDMPLVLQTFDATIQNEPEAQPLFHSDRGFQYTSKQFCALIKREKYYRRKFTSRSSLIDMIHNYMEYYNNRRIQRKQHIMTPMEFHDQYFEAA